MRIATFVSPKHHTRRFKWFYWYPRIHWIRPATFCKWEFVAYWLCFLLVVDEEE